MLLFSRWFCSTPDPQEERYSLCQHGENDRFSRTSAYQTLNRRAPGRSVNHTRGFFPGFSANPASFYADPITDCVLSGSFRQTDVIQRIPPSRSANHRSWTERSHCLVCCSVRLRRARNFLHVSDIFLHSAVFTFQCIGELPPCQISTPGWLRFAFRMACRRRVLCSTLMYSFSLGSVTASRIVPSSWVSYLPSRRATISE